MGFDHWKYRALDYIKLPEDPWPSPQVISILPVVFSFGIAYLVVRSLYRLYFHPLSHIPGPKVAAISHAYEFYHDAIRGGMYLWEVEKMHKKYGPVVRINPREVHIKDPHFYDEVYAPASRKREKDGHFVGVFGFPLSMIATVGHEQHRTRRALLNAFFSKKSVQALAGSVLAEQEAKLVARLTDAHADGKVVRLDDAYAALTADTISQYSWGRSSGFLDDPAFKNDIRAALDEISQFVHVARFFPILTSISRALPRELLRRLRPAATAVLDMQDMVTQSSTEQETAGGRGTVFDALRDESVSPQERSASRLEQEGLILVVAGTETTARTLTIASYHLFSNRPLLLRLRDELRTVMPTPDTDVSWSQLEQLPYLNAVVNEAIRLSFGPIFRSTRVAPTESLTYKKLVIPPGTPISMSTYFVHMDPEIFPEPTSFKPERWIESQGQHLTKFITAFSKGSRNCLGMNLAYAELYLTLAAMIRRFEIELCNTGPENIRIEREMGIGQPVKGDFVVQAKITKILTE
ncbi:cytochrome P450 [Xylaria cf. heliscus]|nr:cytochrome P450 [Xylaria cf. heliscus]